MAFWRSRDQISNQRMIITRGRPDGPELGSGFAFGFGQVDLWLEDAGG
jgi:hypothetical protein